MTKKAERFDTGLFIGRFQPFHKGHMRALESASAECKKLIIGIGSSQKMGTEKNPLSATARIRIIKAALAGSRLGKKRPRFITIPDFKSNNDGWFNYINRRIPKIDVVFSGNRLVKKIFKGHKIAVITLTWYDRGRLSSTNVRRAIRAGRRWQNLVPKGAINEISRSFGSAKR
jgi:nicotinamide-nucleotide adenylyltransferase